MIYAPVGFSLNRLLSRRNEIYAWYGNEKDDTEREKGMKERRNGIFMT
jgi:hypothetical protein